MAKRQIPVLMEPAQETFLKSESRRLGRSMADIVRISVMHFASLTDVARRRLATSNGDANPFQGGAPFKEDRS